MEEGMAIDIEDRKNFRLGKQELFILFPEEHYRR